MACEVFSQALKIAERTQSPRNLERVADLLVQLSDFDGRKRLLADTLEKTGKIQNTYSRSECLASIAGKNSNAGESLLAKQAFIQAIEESGKGKLVSTKSESPCSIIEALAKIGDFVHALELAGQIEEVSRKQFVAFSAIGKSLISSSEFSLHSSLLDQWLDQILLATKGMHVPADGDIEAFSSIAEILVKYINFDKLYQMLEKLLDATSRFDPSRQVKSLVAITDSISSLREAAMRSHFLTLAFTRALEMTEEIKDEHSASASVCRDLIALGLAKVGWFKGRDWLFTQSLAAAEKIECPYTRCEALSSLAEALALSENGQLANEVYTSALECASVVRKPFWGASESSGDDCFWQSKAYAAVGGSLMRSQNIEQALEATGMIRDRSVLSEVLVSISKSLAKIGRFDQSLNIVDAINSSPHKSKALEPIAKALAQAGRYEQALELTNRITSSWNRSSALSSIALALAQAGNATRAAEVFVHAVDEASQIKENRESHQQEALALIAESMAQAGEFFGRTQVFLDILKGTEKFNDWDKSKTIQSVVEALAQCGHFDNRQLLLTHCLSLADGINEHSPKSQALLAISSTMFQTGDVTTATDVLTRALNAVKEIRFHWQQCEALGTVATIIGSYLAPNRQWIETLTLVPREENAFDFLRVLQNATETTQQNLPWLRAFGTLYPARLDIDQKLVSDIVASHISNGNLVLARRIAGRCPSLGLAEILN